MRYEIKGDTLPVVICYLENGERMITERGSMSWMSPNMKMETTSNGGIGKAFGSAYVAMNSKSVGADLVYAWPTAEIAVMGPEGAIAILYHKELAAAEDPVALKKELLAQYREEVANPYIANEKGFIDEVIDPSVTRLKIIRVLKSLEKKSVSLPRRKHGNIPL